MVLERNPNFRGELSRGRRAGRRAGGLLDDAGKPMPFIDKVVFSREKESIPYWNKFLQGYYDASGIGSDNFDQAVQFTGAGRSRRDGGDGGAGHHAADLGCDHHRLHGFQHARPGRGRRRGERARKLRQAISIAVDYEENHLDLRERPRHRGAGPIPPGIFGYREGAEGINPVVYDWVDGKPQRKSIEAARKLLAEAGYPNGTTRRPASRSCSTST